jgi:hypothetical protein
MNTQHSPGPWTEWQSGIFDVDGNIIATISEDGQWNWIEGSNVECAPGGANARLMAAAPELLDVLKALMHAHASHELTAVMEAQMRAVELIDRLTDE